VETEREMVGELILGRFRVERRIGSGGFGTVYRAWDERLERPVAVKVIESEAEAPRVTREAQAVARLDHRNLATLYELDHENGRAFLVSELIDGPTLRELGRNGELSDRLVASLGADCAAALAHAHRNGVVHRDVKPENVLVAPGGEARLVDFGIARIDGESTLTRTGDVLGTLGYMAPEQAAGLRPGPAADVYSLALTTYECLTGEHPRIGDGPAATARAIDAPIEPLTQLRPDLPEPLSETIDAALEMDPELRPLASELESALGAHDRELDGAKLPPVLRPADDAPPVKRALRAPRSLAPAGGVAALTVAALGVAGAPVLGAAAALLAGVAAIACPRAGLAVGAVALVTWLLIGASQPGAALLAAVMIAPLLLVRVGAGAGVSLPGLAPVLGVAGIAAAYPALAGLARGVPARILLGATGYLWLAAFEAVTDRSLLLGASEPAPIGWADSVSETFLDVIVPLAAPVTLAGAALWAAAAVTLPVLVRGRTPVLDVLGALLWAAALISAHRVLAGPDGEPTGLLAATVLAAIAAVLVARRLREAPEWRPGAKTG
jgi:serine/threonine-protein kinase